MSIHQNKISLNALRWEGVSLFETRLLVGWRMRWCSKATGQLTNKTEEQVSNFLETVSTIFTIKIYTTLCKLRDILIVENQREHWGIWKRRKTRQKPNIYSVVVSKYVTITREHVISSNLTPGTFSLFTTKPRTVLPPSVSPP